jgi:hypothetical protein
MKKHFFGFTVVALVIAASPAVYANCSTQLKLDNQESGVSYNFSYCGDSESMIRIYSAREGDSLVFPMPSLEDFKAIEVECARGSLIAAVRTNELNLSGTISTENPMGETVKVRACVYDREGQVVNEQFEKIISMPKARALEVP